MTRGRSCSGASQQCSDFVLPLTAGPDGETDILAGGAIVPVSGPLDNRPAADDLYPAVRALVGKSFDEMAAVLAATAPDPRALPYMSLSPYLRARMGHRRRARRRAQHRALTDRQVRTPAHGDPPGSTRG